MFSSIEDVSNPIQGDRLSAMLVPRIILRWQDILNYVVLSIKITSGDMRLMLLRHIGLAKPSDGGDKELCVELFSVLQNKNLTIHFTLGSKESFEYPVKNDPFDLMDCNANYDIKIFTYRRY
jgi:hypothetical protein